MASDVNPKEECPQCGMKAVEPELEVSMGVYLTGAECGICSWRLIRGRPAPDWYKKYKNVRLKEGEGGHGTR